MATSLPLFTFDNVEVDMYDLTMAKEETGMGVDRERLRQLLTERNMKSTELARAIGVSDAAISLILSGKRTRTRAENAAAMADVFGVSIDWLIGKSDKRAPERSELGDQLDQIVRVARQLPGRKQRDLLLIAEVYLRDSEERATDPHRFQNDLLDLIQEAGGQVSADDLIDLMRMFRKGRRMTGADEIQ